MTRPSTTQVGQAILATLRAGMYDSTAIRASLTDGAAIVPPCVVLTSPSIGFEVLGEGFLTGATEWGLQLYSSNGREPSTGVELAFLDAVVAAFVDSPNLGGVVSGAYLLGSEEAVAVSTSTSETGLPDPPTMYRRAMRLHVDH